MSRDQKRARTETHTLKVNFNSSAIGVSDPIDIILS